MHRHEETVIHAMLGADCPCIAAKPGVVGKFERWQFVAECGVEWEDPMVVVGAGPNDPVGALWCYDPAVGGMREVRTNRIAPVDESIVCEPNVLRWDAARAAGVPCAADVKNGFATEDGMAYKPGVVVKDDGLTVKFEEG